MKKKTPTLTIITICYNIKDEIERTCKSIIDQTWQDFEWIVVDGGSTDGTVDVLKKYADRIDVLISEPDKGIYNAMNKGIKLAHGEWLNFMNGGDCFAANDVLEKVFKNKEYDADVLYGDIYLFDNGNKYSKSFPDHITKEYFINNWISHQGSFIRRKLFNQLGLYNEELKIASDWEKWIVFISQNKSFKHLPYFICTFYKGGLSDNIYKNKQHQKEREQIIQKYFQTEELKKSSNKESLEISLYKLFNFIPLLKTENKDITFVSDNTSIKYYNDFMFHNVKNNTILMVEMNYCHGECLPGMAKYFIDLGYHVDVLISEPEFRLNPFSNFETPALSIFPADFSACSRILSSSIINKYEHVYFNSDYTYPRCSETQKLFAEMQIPQNKIIMMMHHAEKYASYLNDEKHKLVTLSQLPILQNAQYKIVNTNYFGEYKTHKKNSRTNFVVVGNIETKRKNHVNLISTVKTLVDNGIDNFKITVIARHGNLNIPEEVKGFFDFKGRLNYHDMYEEMQKADFYLTLFDPENSDHDRYLSSGSSGSYQLIYGFLKPALLPMKFLSVINRLTEDNSICYETNKDLASAMHKAITMPRTEYDKKVLKLRKLQEEIRQESLHNLQEILGYKTYYIVSGGFDPIHEGHIEMIKASATASDGVIVLANSDDWLCRKKGKNFYTMKTRRAILENLKGVIDVLEFDDSDNSASDGIRKAREKYPDAHLVFANGGDRGKDNIPEGPVCRECKVDMAFGVGGDNKANSSSWILQRWNDD